MLHEISERRSIRKFKGDSVPQTLIEKILKAGMLAPSSKNRQPWKFTVVSESAKQDILNEMENGLRREKDFPLLKNSADYLRYAENTLSIMKQAPVIIFINNILGVDLNYSLDTDERISEICNALSIGAAVENMILEAVSLGLGTLWICDTFFAEEELNRWLNTDGVLYSALAVGYPCENPYPRPRKNIEDAVEWRN